VTQRPAEIDPTILSQCNTVFALRMSNERDQAIVQSAVADTGTGMIEFLPALGAREAIAFGDGVPIPVRIKFDELPANALPRSTTARFSEKWQESLGDEAFLEAVVERWRAAGVCGQLDAASQAQLFAESVSLPASVGLPRRAEPALTERFGLERAQPEPAPERTHVDRQGHEFDTRRAPAPEPQGHPVASAPPMAAPRVELRRPLSPSDVPRTAPASSGFLSRNEPPSPSQADAASAPSNPRLALRERLLKPTIPR
jgi:hypothetical protein